MNGRTPAATIRSYQQADLPDLYAISVLTGDSGQDATRLYVDPALVGHVYSAPYAALEPEGVFVLEDADGVAGYVLGALDTPDFEARLEREWWPHLRTLYPPPPADRPPRDWSADEARHHRIHRPRRTPQEVVAGHPSHLHINLLPRAQHQGHGRRMLDRWLDWAKRGGSPGAHLGVSMANTSAQRFYLAYGWLPIAPEPRSATEPLWMGLRL